METKTQQAGRKASPKRPLLFYSFWAFYPMTPHLVKPQICFLQPDTLPGSFPDMHSRRVQCLLWGALPRDI